MKIFDFFKRKPNSARSVEQSLQRLIDYTPDYYKTHRQFIYSVDFLENREWGLALQSLIELANESEHYFSEEFWTELAQLADRMELKSDKKYCLEQIVRNEQDLNSKTPFGWTTVKLDDANYQHYISGKLKQEWAAKRWDKDKVRDLINADGVYFKPHGRSGSIYFVENKKLAEIDFELGVNALLLYFNSLASWVLPEKQTLTENEKQHIKTEIINWSVRTNNSIEFDD